LTAELWVPRETRPSGAIVFLHGGGWCAGSAQDVRTPVARITERGFVCLNLRYRLAPEHPFPRGLEDAVYAARWLTTNAASYGVDGPIAIGGESAGANLAAATIVALTADEELVGEDDLADVDVEFSAALLLYGIFDFRRLIREPGRAAGGAEIMFNLAYLGPHWLGQHRNPLVSPVYAEWLERFPPTYLSVGSRDAFAGQSLAMTNALAKAGVATTLSVVEECDHAFLRLEDAAAHDELDRICGWLRSHAPTALPA
jgi:acetyl esterase/lipase